MKFIVPETNREVWVNISKYRVDWEKPCRSKFQTEVKKFLYPYLKTHIVAEELRLPKTRLTVDLVDFTTKVAYEIQGKQHQEYVSFFQGNPTNLFKQWGRDAKKEKFLEHNGYTLIQILPDDLEKLSVKFFKEKFGVNLL